MCSAYAWLEPFKLPAALVAQLHTFPQEQDLDATEFERHLNELGLPVGSPRRKHILEAAAIAAYHQQTT